MTSLLDVLFIVLFAALVHAAGLVAKARDEPPPKAAVPACPVAKPEVRPPVVPPSRDVQLLKRRAADALVARSAQAGLIQAEVAAAGRITRLRVEVGTERRDLVVDLPLVERVPDPDVALEYLGLRTLARRVCTTIRRALGRTDLGGALVLLQPERDLELLPVALVEGMRQDLLHCYPDENGLAVLLPGPASQTKDTP
jgi:hypothetical protein